MHRYQAFALGCVCLIGLGLTSLGLISMGGCVRALKTSRPPASDETVTRGHLVLHCDFACPERHRLMDELMMLRDELGERLALRPSDAPIDVYLFEQGEAYYRFLEKRFPDFPARRALFVQTDAERTVFAHWGSQVVRDLRHEVTHATLHAMLPDLPLWLDEGLAEYFEVVPDEAGPGKQRLNRPHVEYLQELAGTSGWQPDMQHLQGLQSADKMDQQEYAESWAWVHFLLETDYKRRGLLLQYLVDLQKDQSAMPLSDRLAGTPDQAELALVSHVVSLK